LKRSLWIVPIVLAVAVFSCGINNFFVYDDFIWLYRAKTLGQNWKQMFYPDVMYFDPLIYLGFLVNYSIAGFDPRWYHAIDLALHAINAFLLYRFAELLSGERKTALYAGILFASSFAIADAVLWPSSRVDLVSTCFALGTLLQYLKYLRNNSSRHLLMSCLFFILALGAKGTPVVIPAVLLWLCIQERKPLTQASSLLPFAAVIVVYAVSAKLMMNHASLPLDKLHLNLRNLELAFCSLYIPEGTLKYLDLNLCAFLLFALVSSLSLPALSYSCSISVRRTGYCLLMVSLLPMLPLTDFKLLTEYSNPYLLLLSASHRIYLASTGAALVGAGFFRTLEQALGRLHPKLAISVVALALTAIVSADIYLVKERNQLWQDAGNWTRVTFNGLTAYRGKIAEGNQIGLINFPGSRGFTTPMLKLSLDLNDLTVLSEVKTGPITNIDVLRKAEKTQLFVLSKDLRVHDKGELFRRQLLTNRMWLLDPRNPQREAECQALSGRLLEEINALLD
jgi:hypothetical protein